MDEGDKLLVRDLLHKLRGAEAETMRAALAYFEENAEALGRIGQICADALRQELGKACAA